MNIYIYIYICIMYTPSNNTRQIHALMREAPNTKFVSVIVLTWRSSQYLKREFPSCNFFIYGVSSHFTAE